MIQLTSLSTLQQKRRAELEAIIDQHIGEFVRVAAALAQIKAEQLWRSTHESFAAFMGDKFQRCQSYGYELAAAGEVLYNLSGIPEIPTLPAAASQCRPLTKLEPEDQPTAWKAALNTSAGSPTAATVRQAVEAVSSTPPAVSVGQSVYIDSPISPYSGREAEVVAKDGLIFQCKIDGAVLPFLCNEISTGSSPKSVEPALPRQAKPPTLEAALSAEIEIEQAHSELLSLMIGRLITAIRSGIISDQLLLDAERLIS